MKTLVMLFILGQSADMGTTTAAIRQGCVEMNPLFQPPAQTAKIVVVKAGATLGISLLSWKIQKKHPRYARTILVIGAVAGFGAAGWNVGQQC